MSKDKGIPMGSDKLLTGFFLSPWIYHTLRLFVGGLFLYTGATKLADIAGFGKAIAAYGLLPAGLISCAAIGLPALEVGAGFGTLVNRRWGIWSILVLLLLFMGVLGYGIAVGLEIDCGCFSTGKTAQTARVKPPSVLEIPPNSSSLQGNPVAGIEPVQPGTADEGTCSEKEAGASSLKKAFVRDILLLIGVIYLAAWPGKRKRQLKI